MTPSRAILRICRPSRVRAFPVLLAMAVAPMIPGRDPLVAQEREPPGRFEDPEDGRFDLSAHLVTAAGFLPLLSLITEPAVDYGLAGAAAFFHRPPDWSIQAAREAFDRGERQRPPSVSVVAGAYTLNNSWFTGGGHLGIWRGDRLRYVGFGGYGSFNLTLSGLSGGDEDRSFDYNLEGWGLVQSLKWRLADSRWFLGATWKLVGLTAGFETAEVPELEPYETESRNGSLGAVLAYDSRDNIFSPNRGVSGSVEGSRHDDALLGDYDYWEGSASVTGYAGLGSRVVLGGRGMVTRVGEGAPFWALPGVQMRGVPAQRYLGTSEAQGEGELRWDLDRRWSVVGFGGVGWTRNTVQEETSSRTVGAGGIGFRYLLARAFGVRGGIDLAYGPDGGAVYVTVGSAWR